TGLYSSSASRAMTRCTSISIARESSRVYANATAAATSSAERGTMRETHAAPRTASRPAAKYLPSPATAPTAVPGNVGRTGSTKSRPTKSQSGVIHAAGAAGGAVVAGAARDVA